MLASLLVLTSFASTPKSVDLVKAVMAKYATVKSFSATFRSIDSKTKKVVYTGSFDYEIKSFSRFSLTDPAEECTAGEDLNEKGQGSTWVTPPEMRGYNDTVSSRHPYLLADLTQKKLKLDTDYQWYEKVQVIKKGKAEFWRLNSKDGLTLTINSKTKLITEFTSKESYHPEFPLVTLVTY